LWVPKRGEAQGLPLQARHPRPAKIRELRLTCPICEQRKAKRFCPARAETICSVCCGTEREVTIACPARCPHLITSRQYDHERREIDWSKMPFADTKIPSAFVVAHERLVAALSFVICQYAQANRSVVDADAQAALAALAESYRTLASGIYYEHPPASLLQKGFYDALKKGIEDYKKAEAQRAGMSTVRDSEIRDTLILLTQLGATHANGRPKGRAYLDFLRNQFPAEQFSQPASNLIVMP